MNKTIIASSLLVFILLFRTVAECAEIRGEMADRYYGSFSIADGTSMRYVMADLRNEVPLSEWPELFASIIDRGGEHSDGARKRKRRKRGQSVHRCRMA